MNEIKEVQTKSLPKKVTIKPLRKHTWLPENHDGSHRYSGTYESLTLQVDRHTGVLITGLTDKEEIMYEKELRLNPGTLSKHNTEYWTKFKLPIPKDGVILKPSETPTDALTYTVMLAHQEVAESMGTKNNKPFARYVMHSEEEETETLNKEFNLKFEAYKKIGEMSENQKINFLTVYGKKVGKGSSLDFINAQIGKIADTEPNLFLDTLNNPNYKTTVFIKQCTQTGVLKETAGKYCRPGGEVIGYSMDQTIDFLKNPDNQEVYASIKAQLEAVK